MKLRLEGGGGWATSLILEVASLILVIGKLPNLAVGKKEGFSVSEVQRVAKLVMLFEG